MIHVCRREACETEACRGVSHGRSTQAYWQSVEEAERESSRLEQGSDDGSDVVRAKSSEEVDRSSHAISRERDAGRRWRESEEEQAGLQWTVCGLTCQKHICIMIGNHGACP